MQERDRPAPVAAEVVSADGLSRPGDTDVRGRSGPYAGRDLADGRDRGRRGGQIAVADHGPQFESRARTVPATTVPLVTKAGEAHVPQRQLRRTGAARRSTFTASATARTGASGSRSRPPASGAEPFRFLYVGDAQNSIKSHWSRVIRAAFAARPMPASSFTPVTWSIAAPTTPTGASGSRPAGWIHEMLPSLPSPGNHEYEKSKEEQPRTRPRASRLTGGPSSRCRRTVPRGWKRPPTTSITRASG